MPLKRLAILTLSLVCLSTGASAQPPAFDAELAKKLGADERGMRMFVLCILKTGPKDGEIKGEERNQIFAGHFANIGRLADEGKLAVAGPFGKNDKSYRGLYIFNVATIEEAEKLVQLDPAVKAGVFVPDLTPWYGSAAMRARATTASSTACASSGSFAKRASWASLRPSVRRLPPVRRPRSFSSRFMVSPPAPADIGERLQNRFQINQLKPSAQDTTGVFAA